MKTTLQVLIDARKLIEKPENWCQGWVARAADGSMRTSDSDDAVSFCMVGAITRAGGGDDFATTDKYRRLMLGESVSFGDFNDTHTHAEVLAAFDRTIEAERSKATGAA